jgi:hypothetical protein
MTSQISYNDITNKIIIMIFTQTPDYSLSSTFIFQNIFWITP